MNREMWKSDREASGLFPFSLARHGLEQDMCGSAERISLFTEGLHSTRLPALRGMPQGNRMNTMRLPVKGEERREKGAPGLLFRPALGKNAVCFCRTIADRRFFSSLFSLLPSRNRFMRLPWGRP